MAPLQLYEARLATAKQAGALFYGLWGTPDADNSLPIGMEHVRRAAMYNLGLAAAAIGLTDQADILSPRFVTQSFTQRVE